MSDRCMPHKCRSCTKCDEADLPDPAAMWRAKYEAAVVEIGHVRAAKDAYAAEIRELAAKYEAEVVAREKAEQERDEAKRLVTYWSASWLSASQEVNVAQATARAAIKRADAAEAAIARVPEAVAELLYLTVMQETREHWPTWEHAPDEVKAGYRRDADALAATIRGDA